MEEPEDPCTFLDIVQDDNNQAKADLEKQKADKDRMAGREKTHKELGLECLPHLPFIQYNDETQHQIKSAIKHLDDLINGGLKMKTEHDDRVKILYECLIDQDALIKNLNERTISLLGSLRDTSTRIQEMYDDFLFHAHQSADVVSGHIQDQEHAGCPGACGAPTDL